MMMAARWTLRVLTAAGALLICTANLTAQSGAMFESAATDARWTPWLGCWELLDEGLPTFQERRSSADDDLRICVAPGESAAAVRVTTLAGNATLQEETIVSDGTRRVIQEPACAGWRQAEWSRNGHRLFASAELACPDEPLRQVSGIALMAPGGVWVDIQVVSLGGRESVRVRRYRPAADPDATSAALRARPAPPFSIDDVIEAASKAGRASVAAALVELGMSFEMNSRTLVRLEEAGVPPGVIDVMVAVSYPDKFLVQRTEPTQRIGNPLQSWSLGGFEHDPYSYYSPFGYSSFFGRRGYSPYGYSPWGAYSPFYLGGLTTIVVVPSGGKDRPADPSGRAVNGRGYTRARPRDAAAGDTRGSSGQERTSGTADSPRSGSTGSSGGTSSGGTVSPQGASSGGTGGGSDRTARPR